MSFVIPTSVDAAFRAALDDVIVNGRVAQPAVDSGVPVTPPGRVRRRLRRGLASLLRRALRPVATRWRRYANAPLHAEIAELRASLGSLRSSAYGSNRVPLQLPVDLELDTMRLFADETIVWRVDGTGIPHLGAATQRLTSGSTLTAETSLRGLAAVGDSLGRWAAGISHDAAVTITIEFPGRSR